jgi:hypothetical protein
MFQMGEFVSLVLISILGSILFLGGWSFPFGNDAAPGLQAATMGVKTIALILFFMWMRGSLPRLRIDQLMSFCWQLLLPFAFLQIALNGLVLVYDWEKVTLTVFSTLAAAAAVYLTYRAARRAGLAPFRPAGPAGQPVGGVL